LEEPVEDQPFDPNNPPTSGQIVEIVISALPAIASSYAGREYFGGFGGALLGYAIYAVTLKPFLHSPAAKAAP
jgi:hypothetical protein